MKRALPLLLACLLSGCAANPGPPPVVEDEPEVAETSLTSASDTTPTPAPAPAPERTKVSVGVDALIGGLNPYLMADNQQIVQEIAQLVLPSPFRGGVMDSDLLRSAEEVDAPEGSVQRVRYEISPAAQWSDGTPISGADFRYVWQGMKTTPGVVHPAGYRAISAVTSSAGGKIVTVDFTSRVEDWRSLFPTLLPAHVLAEQDFASALSTSIPVSAGRFAVESVDSARGIITLNRNDRFWGADPAHIDIIELHQLRAPEQAVAMLRSGQVGFASFVPAQTTPEALSLLPEVDAEFIHTTRQLRLHLTNARKGAREELAGALDTAQIARLATGRTDNLRVPYGGRTPQPGPPLERTLRIGADPTDAVALAAAHAIVDQLNSRGASATVVSDRLSDLIADYRELDGLVAWNDTAITPGNMADFFVCQVASDCPADAVAVQREILSGEIPPGQALELVREHNAQDYYYVPLLDETRMNALGTGISGPGDKVSDWRSGLVSAAQWRVGPEPSLDRKVSRHGGFE
ncbi:ABC transporter family substrate-binding protein [Corynebacterium lizhenjunii]|uniref:ABC transporter family substrate-binding protein n=1 Tax=Corynebacterium lizhenjunii TaxID=2709394 RepID=UPI0013EB7464|nr:ABC transporter family substrate-binding protein [Corynebacterium lizhenjunii]